MSRSNITDVFRNALNVTSTDEVLIALLDIDHETLADTIRISSDATQLLDVAGVLGTVHNSNEYLYYPFSVKLPSQDQSSISKAQLVIDNVDRSIIRTLRTARTAIDFTIKIVLASDPDTIEAQVLNLKLRDVEYDKFVISGDIAVKLLNGVAFPAKRFTPAQFPGIY